MSKANIVQIQEKISLLKKKCSSIISITNYYNQMNLREKEFETWIAESTIIFWYEKMSISYVFFCSYDEKELYHGLQQLPEKAVFHVASKNKDVTELWEKRTGYRLYSIYGRFGYTLGSLEEEKQRFASMKLDRFYDENLGYIAKKEDLLEIQELIYNNFDPFCDQLFSNEEMENLIENKNVWIEREGKEICTIFIFQIEGKKYYANLALNRSTADVLHSIQKKSVLQAIEENQVVYFYGWQALDNKQASRKHGYPDFDLYDYILRK